MAAYSKKLNPSNSFAYERDATKNNIDYGIVLKRLLKGGTSGVVLYAGVKVFTALMRNPFRKKLPDIWQEIFSIDCLRFASLLGLYPSIYTLMMQILQKARSKTDGWNSILASGIAGLTLFIESKKRRNTIALWTLARALGALSATLIRRGAIRSIPHGSTITFSLCCSLLVYCVAMKPHLLAKGYYYSVLKWSRDYSNKKLNILFRQRGERFLSCNEVGLHPGSCSYHAMTDWLWSFPAFAKLYLPIHMTPILVFRYKLIFSDFSRVFKSLLKNTVQSTLFISFMVMIAKYAICILRNYHHSAPPLPTYIPFVAGLLAGLPILFERQTRRKELCMFLIPNVLQALIQLGLEMKVIRYIRYGSVPVFALSMMPILHAYEREPESLTMLVRGVLKYFVG